MTGYVAALRAEASRVMERLDAKAGELPDDGPPPVRQAYRQARQAAVAAATALQIDPTLAAIDRDRDLAVLEELLRQIKPLGRQAEVWLERQRLAALRGTEREIALLGRVNPLAIEELAVLAERALRLAEQIIREAMPDWESPERIRERSARLLPSPGRLEQIAGQLRSAVRSSLACPHPDPEAVRLAALADQISPDAKTEQERERLLATKYRDALDHADKETDPR